MLIDTHIHLYSQKFDSDRDEVVRRASDAGVGIMILPAIDVRTTEAAIALAQRYPGVHAMAALHPSEAAGATEEDFEHIERLCSDPFVVAVGESGLDYYWDRSFDQAQKHALDRHIQIAKKSRLPLILHSRDKQGSMEVFEDLVEILREAYASDHSTDADAPRGIFHCFGGPSWLPAVASELKFLLGIGGTLTFKNGGVAAMLEEVPLDQIVLETDAPYLAPEPHRGRRNEPSNIPVIAKKLAEVKGVTLEEVAAVTTHNASRIFGLMSVQDAMENRNSVRDRNT